MLTWDRRTLRTFRGMVFLLAVELEPSWDMEPRASDCAGGEVIESRTRA